MFKAKPMTTSGAWQGPVAPKSTGLAPEVLAEQQRLAQKYGIKTYDRRGNVTYDGSNIPKAKATNIQVPRTLEQFAKTQQRQDIPTPKAIDTSREIEQPQVQLLPQAQAQPISDLVSEFRVQQLERQGPPERPDRFTSLQSFAEQSQQQELPDVQTQQQTPSALEENERLARLNLQKIRAEEKVEELKRRVTDIDDDMFNEAQRIRNLTGNANINVENEAELLDLSNRYKALYTDRDLLATQLDDAERELQRVDSLYSDASVEESTRPEERVSISGVADFNPMEKGGQLSPVYIPARSPEERAIASGNSGTLIDPNFDLMDVSKSTLNLGIPTTETIPSGTGVDEIREIDSGMQEAAAAADGVAPERVLDDPVSAQLEGLRKSGDGLATFFGPQQTVQEQLQQEPTELELQEQREEIELEEPTFERDEPRGIEGLSLTPEVQQRIEEAQQQAAIDAELQEQQEQQEALPQPSPIDEAGQSFSTQRIKTFKKVLMYSRLQIPKWKLMLDYKQDLYY
jgi:hypothetical protein